MQSLSGGLGRVFRALLTDCAVKAEEVPARVAAVRRSVGLIACRGVAARIFFMSSQPQTHQLIEEATLCMQSVAQLLSISCDGTNMVNFDPVFFCGGS